MRSMVEGADICAASVTRPLHRLRRSPSPAATGEEPGDQSGGTRFALVSPALEVRRSHFGLLQKLLAGACHGHQAVHHDIAAVREF